MVTIKIIRIATFLKLAHYSSDTRGNYLDLQTEKLLIEEAKRDQTYFGQLFDVYYPAILNYTVKRTGDVAVAQDITAETFYKAMVNLGKFKWQGVSISSWLYKIATNEIRMYYRRTKYQPASLDVLFANGFEVADEHEFTQEIIDAQDAVERSLAFKQAQQMLKALPIKYQEVITLRFAEKKKISEIALILGKKDGTVKSLLSRGLDKLRTAIEQAETQRFQKPDIIASEGHILMTQEAYEE